MSSALTGTARIEDPPRGLPNGALSCRILFASDGRGQKLEVVFDSLGIQEVVQLLGGPILDELHGKRFLGKFEDGRDFSGTISFGVGCSPVTFGPSAEPSPVTATCLIGTFEIGDRATAMAASGGDWIFAVANFDLPFGDLATERTSPGGQASRRDRIEIDFAGRRWVLRSVEVQAKGDSGDGRNSLARVELRTARVRAEGPEEAAAGAETVLALVSFGYATFVKWSTLRLESAGSVRWVRSSPDWIPGYGHGGLMHVTQHAPGDLKGYLEACAPVVAAEPAWWLPTIEFYLQSALSPFVEFKLSVLLSLLDRIVAYVIRGKEPALQIGPGFDALTRRADFRDALHNFLITNYRGWTPERTDALLDTLRRWNSEPSYVRAVQRACENLAVPSPISETLRLRHRLLHGYKDPILGKVLDAAWIEIDDCVSLMLLRLLGFNGSVYLARPQALVRMDRISSAGYGS